MSPSGSWTYVSTSTSLDGGQATVTAEAPDVPSVMDDVLATVTPNEPPVEQLVRAPAEQSCVGRDRCRDRDRQSGHRQRSAADATEEADPERDEEDDRDGVDQGPAEKQAAHRDHAACSHSSNCAHARR